MRFRQLITLLIPTLLTHEVAFAQLTEVKRDSSEMYRDIETFSKKRKSTRFLYGIFFKPVESDAAQKIARKKKKKPPRSYSAYQGLIIRNIQITTLDPFGNSAQDTGNATKNGFYTTGNDAHVKTQRLTILNLLLIRKNQPFDSLRARESERLIRSQKYVRDVSFTVQPTSKHSDSVDINIRVLDSWSLIPKASISSSGYRFGLTDRNFIGTGHEFQNEYARNDVARINAVSMKYGIPNIRNTYISTDLHYAFDNFGNFDRGIAVDRPFYTPLAKWAAGVSLSSVSINDSMLDRQLEFVPLHLKYNTQDYWAGDAQRIFKGNTVEERVTNIIFSMRYLRIRYDEKPPELLDPLHRYAAEDFYLAGIGISGRSYNPDHHIFNFGVTEDVPAGKVFAVTVGYQVKNNLGRTYAGLRFSFGNYHDWGYLGMNFEYGTFFHSSHAEQGAFTATSNYFSNLLEIGNWKIRQFIKPQLTLGFNRFPYENITINDANGIRGFNSTTITGIDKVVLTLQTQSYSPWHILGFRFGPYLICSFGMLGDAVTGFEKSKIYSQFGIGVLIKNEYLVINQFQLSISFYPDIPGGGENLFKMNSNITTDFGFQDYILGKPVTVVYQ